MTALPIALPDGFVTLVAVSDTVVKGQAIAERSQLPERIIPVAALLKVPVRRAKKTLLKNPGDTIYAGDTIARKKSKLGIKEDKLVVTASGIISRFDRGTGELVLLEQETVNEGNQTQEASNGENQKRKILSPIDGVVTICDNGKIVIETDKNVFRAKSGIGETAEGEIFSFLSSEKKEVEPHELHSDIIGKVLFGELFSREVLLKAMGMEAAAIIGTEIAEEDLTYIQERNIKTPVFVIEDDLKTTLGKWIGKRVYLDGNTQSILLVG